MQIIHEIESPENYPGYHESEAVVSVLLQKADQCHPVISSIEPSSIDNLDSIDLGSIFTEKENSKFYHYKGSHTAPPSLDIVNWFILKNPLNISNKKLHFLEEHWHDSHGFTNFRISQPLYGRRVVRNFKWSITFLSNESENFVHPWGTLIRVILKAMKTLSNYSLKPSFS